MEINAQPVWCFACFIPDALCSLLCVIQASRVSSVQILKSTCFENLVCLSACGELM